MQRLTLLSSVIYALIFVGLATRRGEFLLLSLPLFLFLLVGLLRRPVDPKLSVSRHTDAERVQEETPVELTVDLTNNGASIDRLVLQVPTAAGVTLQDGPTRLVARGVPGEKLTLTQQVLPSRGLHALPAIDVTIADRFALFPRRFSFQDNVRLLALPQVLTGADAGVRPPRTRVFAGPIGANKGGPGVEFFGVRAYQPGDARQWINQRATARRPDEIFVNEFEQERAVDIGLILDVRSDANLVSTGDSLLEASVAAAATLADSFLTAGNRVGLFLYGGSIDWTLPGYGKIQRERILRVLARAKTEQHQIFRQLGYLPTRLFPIRSQLVLISPLLIGDLEDLISLRARGYELMIMTPDAVAFEAETRPDNEAKALAIRMARLERERFFHQLRQAGIIVFEWSADVPFAHAARTRSHEIKHWRRGPDR